MPNPFNPETKIKFKLAENAEVSLTVLDVMGREVAHILQDTFHPAGSYSYFWNGRDDFGRFAASGIYMVMFDTGVVREIEKIMLVR